MQEMKIKVKAGFLALPVSEFVGNHRVLIRHEGRVVGEANLRLDYLNPSAASYYPIGEYMGEELTVSVSPDMELRDEQTDNPDHDRIGEAFRPLVHFTADYGWINDPNGLLKYTSPVTKKTTYHMFYQYNPYDWAWENMHWGHAVSDDMLHWRHLKPALCPDDDGTMFSGSAIVDHENRSGLKDGDEDVILLFYTCAGNTSYRSGGKKFTQCLAYSNDGGMTFRKYEKNPIVGHIAADNRDPKVIWCPELDKYIMALYLESDEYALLTSDNFLKWEMYTRLNIERDSECPDFYPLNTDGDVKKRKWVLSGAAHRYIIGEFVDGKFRVIQASRPLNNGWNSYAAQTFSTDDEMERIQIAWDRNHSFGSAKICGQMSIPYRMSLMEDKDGYHLCASPIEELDSLCRSTIEYDNVVLSENKSLHAALDESAYKLDLTLNPRNLGSNIDIFLFGQRIAIESSLNTICVKNDTMPISMTGKKTKITFIIDKGSVEVFSCEGRAMMTTPWILNFNERYITFAANGEGSAEIEKISLKKLRL